MIKRQFVIYHDYVPKIGGIETAIYNLTKNLEDIDVLIAVRSYQDIETVWKYSEYADFILLQPEDKIECDVCLIGSNHSIPKQIKADRYLQWVHSDYKKYPQISLQNIGKIDKYVAVTQHSADVIKELYNQDCKVIYNLTDPEFGKDRRKVLRLITNSRVSPEKGFDRMLIMCKKLRENNVRFQWFVYGDNSSYRNIFEDYKNKFVNFEEVTFMGFKHDVELGFINADFLVQLSDFEGCPLSVLESLAMGVPVIVTNWGGVEDLVEDGVNGYIVDMELDNLDIKKITKKIPKFVYKPKSSGKDWVKLITDEYEV